MELIKPMHRMDLSLRFDDENESTNNLMRHVNQTLFKYRSILLLKHSVLVTLPPASKSDYDYVLSEYKKYWDVDEFKGKDGGRMLNIKCIFVEHQA